MIDIGGPTMVRAAAKNCDSVAVVTDPSQYAQVLEELQANDGALTKSTRRRLARDAFFSTARYVKPAPAPRCTTCNAALLALTSTQRYPRLSAYTCQIR